MATSQINQEANILPIVSNVNIENSLLPSQSLNNDLEEIDNSKNDITFGNENFDDTNEVSSTVLDNNYSADPNFFSPKKHHSLPLPELSIDYPYTRSAKSFDQNASVNLIPQFSTPNENHNINILAKYLYENAINQNPLNSNYSLNSAIDYNWLSTLLTSTNDGRSCFANHNYSNFPKSLYSQAKSGTCAKSFDKHCQNHPTFSHSLRSNFPSTSIDQKSLFNNVQPPQPTPLSVLTNLLGNIQLVSGNNLTLLRSNLVTANRNISHSQHKNGQFTPSSINHGKRGLHNIFGSYSAQTALNHPTAKKAPVVNHFVRNPVGINTISSIQEEEQNERENALLTLLLNKNPALKAKLLAELQANTTTSLESQTTSTMSSNVSPIAITDLISAKVYPFDQQQHFNKQPNSSSPLMVIKNTDSSHDWDSEANISNTEYSPFEKDGKPISPVFLPISHSKPHQTILSTITNDFDNNNKNDNVNFINAQSNLNCDLTNKADYSDHQKSCVTNQSQIKDNQQLQNVPKPNSTVNPPQKPDDQNLLFAQITSPQNTNQYFHHNNPIVSGQKGCSMESHLLGQLLSDDATKSDNESQTVGTFGRTRHTSLTGPNSHSLINNAGQPLNSGRKRLFEHHNSHLKIKSDSLCDVVDLKENLNQDVGGKDIGETPPPQRNAAFENDCAISPSSESSSFKSMNCFQFPSHYLAETSNNISANYMTQLENLSLSANNIGNNPIQNSRPYATSILDVLNSYVMNSNNDLSSSPNELSKALFEAFTQHQQAQQQYMQSASDSGVGLDSGINLSPNDNIWSDHSPSSLMSKNSGNISLFGHNSFDLSSPLSPINANNPSYLLNTANSLNANNNANIFSSPPQSYNHYKHLLKNKHLSVPPTFQNIGSINNNNNKETTNVLQLHNIDLQTILTDADKLVALLYPHSSAALGGLLPETGEKYSRKVFVGGLPPDIDEEEITNSFRHFGFLIVDWPHKAESKSFFPPKGYAFLLFQDEYSVQSLIDACYIENGKHYIYVSSPTIKDKPVQIRAWSLADADFVLDSSQPLDPRKTIFVGGVPRPLRALELALIMDRLYGNVCYAGIDTDPELKYPKGAGRVAFSTQQSYVAAISARFVQLQHGDIDKRVEVKPYVLDDQCCDECGGARCAGKLAPFFCANVSCLKYFCEPCWTLVHSRQPGKEYHKPLVKEGGDRPRMLPFRLC